MQPVVQEHREGCMLACAAMLANLTYGDVAVIAEKLGICAGDKRLYTSTEPMHRLLTRLGIGAVASVSDFRTWQELPDRCLLATKWHIKHGLPHWHWVAFLRDASGPVVLDPAAHLKNNRRKDFRRIKPKWFLAV